MALDLSELAGPAKMAERLAIRRVERPEIRRAETPGVQAGPAGRPAIQRGVPRIRRVARLAIRPAGVAIRTAAQRQAKQGRLEAAEAQRVEPREVRPVVGPEGPAHQPEALRAAAAW